MEVKEKEDLTNENNVVLTDEKEELQPEESFTIINDYQNTNRSDVLTIFGILTFIFIIILLITFVTFTLINTKSETIANGIYIKGIDVSGLTKDEAELKTIYLYKFIYF